MKIVGLVVALLLIGLGGLWLVQGLGLLVIKPILCFADCVPLVGPSTPWTVAGIVALAIGLLLLRRGLRKR